MDACTDRRLGIHASALLVVYGERRSTRMMSSRPVRRAVSPRDPTNLPHDVWPRPVR